MLAALAVALVAAAPAPAEQGEPTRDCVGESMLDGGNKRAIKFVVWCSIESGKFSFELQRSDGGRENPVLPILAYTERPRVSGAGAGRASCRLGAEWLRCRGQKSAQVVVRGRIAVPVGTRCAVKVRIETEMARSAGRPAGCPGTRPQRPDFGRSSLRSYRDLLGLLDGLDPEEIRRRIDASVRNWRRGEPVARVTAQEIGMPLLPVEQRQIVFRDELLNNMDAIEAWFRARPTDTFAGYELVDGQRPVLYVGFTGDQVAQLAELKREVKLFAPNNIEPFPVQPLYTESQLWDIGMKLVESDPQLERLIIEAGVATLENKVRIGTEHVAKVKRLLAERFGPDGPFLVVFERGGTFL
ncbi:MAG TPA: hypothetical protein VFB52_13430 [Solirubrobacterales bacterium]|nr:hypothetical protein [Solirubrobacterales bacterium]